MFHNQKKKNRNRHRNMKIVVFWFSFKTKHSAINLTPFFYRSDFSNFFNLFFFEMNNFKHTKSVFGQQTSSFFQFEANVFRIAIYLLIKCYATFAFLSKISAATNNFNCTTAQMQRNFFPDTQIAIEIVQYDD